MTNINDLKNYLLNSTNPSERLRAAEILTTMASKGNEDASDLLYQMLIVEQSPQVWATPFNLPMLSQNDARGRFVLPEIWSGSLWILPMAESRRLGDTERNAIVSFAKSAVATYQAPREGFDRGDGGDLVCGSMKIIAKFADRHDLLSFVLKWLKEKDSDVDSLLTPLTGQMSLLKEIILEIMVNTDSYSGKFIDILGWFLNHPHPYISETVGLMWVTLPSNYKEAVRLHFAKESAHYARRGPDGQYVIGSKHPLLEWLESFDRRLSTGLNLTSSFSPLPTRHNERQNVMLDPSLLLTASGLKRVLQFIEHQNTDFSFYISQSFYEFIADDKRRNERVSASDPVIKFFGARVSYFNEAKMLIRENMDHWTLFEPTEELRLKHSIFRDSLLYRESTKNQELFDILFDEWIFLQERSWLLAKSKLTFEKFKEGGAISLEFGEKAMHRIAARTLKTDHHDPLSNFQKLRALAKWMAVGGSASEAFLSPYLGLLAGLTTGFFLMLDPDITIRD